MASSWPQEIYNISSGDPMGTARSSNISVALNPDAICCRSGHKNLWKRLLWAARHILVLNRTAKLLADNPTLLSTPLLEGFPQKLDSPLVWEGKDSKNESQWVYHLSSAELLEIDEAVHHFNGKLKPVEFYCLCWYWDRFGHSFRPYIPWNAPFADPRTYLGQIITRTSLWKRGFCHLMLRTIPVDSYSKADNVLIYAGVSSYVAGQRGLQDVGGGVLSHDWLDPSEVLHSHLLRKGSIQTQAPTL